MSDEIKSMGSLLSKMTAETSGEVRFNENQISAVVEVLIPRLITGMPGMPKGFTCSIDRDDTGWTVRIERPKA